MICSGNQLTGFFMKHSFGLKYVNLKANQPRMELAQHIKWSFPLRISSVNVTKLAENCGVGHIYWSSQETAELVTFTEEEIFNGKLDFFCTVGNLFTSISVMQLQRGLWWYRLSLFYIILRKMKNASISLCHYLHYSQIYDLMNKRNCRLLDCKLNFSGGCLVKPPTRSFVLPVTSVN